jgi:hypothetical protein
VIGDSDGVETALGGATQDIENTDRRLLVVGRGGGVNVKVDTAPGEFRRG